MWTGEIMPYLGRLGTTWGIRTLSRLAQVSRALRDSGWERRVTHLGGHVTERLTDTDLLRFAPHLQSLVYRVPCDHRNHGKFHAEAIGACMSLRHLGLYATKCRGRFDYPALMLPDSLRDFGLNNMAAYRHSSSLIISRAVFRGIRLVFTSIWQSTFDSFIQSLAARIHSGKDGLGPVEGYTVPAYHPGFSFDHKTYMPPGDYPVRWMDTATGEEHSNTIVILKGTPTAKEEEDCDSDA